MADFEKPFDGAISDYFETQAPEGVRAAITDGGKGDVLEADYPYPEEMGRKDYEAEMHELQIALMRMQLWAQETGARVVVVFEGRDAAGKGGTIKRFTENLSPRQSKVVALSKPSDVERGEWYFQRYIRHMPTAGQIVFFDRSWYNRGVVEKVFGFCSDEERSHFFAQVNDFEGMLVGDGIHLFKLWLNVGRAEQLRRFLKRESDPLKHWKLSGIDVKGLAKWEAYSTAISQTFVASHSQAAPWNVIRSDDKKRARLAAIRLVLSGLDVPGMEVARPDADICGTPSQLGLI